MQDKIMPTIYQSGRALVEVANTLNSLKIPFILDGGTLLGFYRDKTFCTDDHDDIDFTVHCNFWVRAQEIVDEMLKLGFTVYHEWSRNMGKHYSGQISFKRIENESEVKIDIMFKELKKETQMMWWTVYGGTAGVTYKAIPAALIAHCNTIEISVPVLEGNTIEVKVGMPVMTEEYLAYRYGDWKTPVHRSKYSCYTTDKCLIQPNSYDAI